MRGGYRYTHTVHRYRRALATAASSGSTPLASTQPISKDTPILSTSSLPAHAAIVIIGGGVIGCSIAYHLSLKHAQPSSIYLLERSQLTHGCTWHAAGLLGQLRSTKNLTRMLQYSAQLYSQLKEETGIDPEWKGVGSLRLASSMERWKEIKVCPSHSYT